MAIVSPSQINPGDAITASSVNTPVNQLAAEINGNIDSTNLKDGGIASADLGNGAVTTDKIADGAVGPNQRTGGFAIRQLDISTTGAKAVADLNFKPKFVQLSIATTTSNVSSLVHIGQWDGANYQFISGMSRGSDSYNRTGNGASSTPSFPIWSIDSGGALQLVAQLQITAFTDDGITYTVGTADATKTVTATFLG